MIEIDQKLFEQMVSEAIDAIPPLYMEYLDNVAFVVEDNPTPEQRKRLGLRCHQTLFGLYEGIPLTKRGVNYSLVLPDKITIFKQPIESVSYSAEDVKEQIHRTVWHEVAHYYGLDHDRIHALERKGKKNGGI